MKNYFFIGFLITIIISLCFTSADLQYTTEENSKYLQSSDIQNRLTGDEKSYLNQSNGSILPVQSGSSLDQNDSSKIHRTSATHLTGEKSTSSSTDSLSNLPDGTHFGPGSGSSSPSPTPVMSEVPTPFVTSVPGLPDGTHFGPGSGSTSPTLTPVMSEVPTPFVTQVPGLPDGTHFEPGSGSSSPAPTAVKTGVVTPVMTPVSGLPDGSHSGPYNPAPTPSVTPIAGFPNNTQPEGPDFTYPGRSPDFTQPVTPITTPGQGYPDGRYHPGPIPIISQSVTPTVPPTPEYHYSEPTHVPGDNDPDPIMSDILLHIGDPNYYNSKYSYPDPGHYRYDSSTLYSPRYDRDSGAVQVISTPSGATVYLNNNYEGKTPSSGYLGISSLTPGDYQITVSYVGYYDYTTIITVYRNEVITVNAVLEPGTSGSTSSIVDGGTLDVQSSPSGAGILLNNVYRGSSPMTLQSINPGQYNLTVFKEGYFWYARDISIVSGQTTAISAVLTPENQTPGDQNSESVTEFVAPVPTKSPLPIWVLLIALFTGGFLALRRQ